MRDHGSEIHRESLLDLIKPVNLEIIDENAHNLRTMLVEPSFYKHGCDEENQCPDLFLGYQNGLWSVIELKHSYKKREKAFRQIESGFELLHDVFNIRYDDMRGKFVTYENGFMYENYISV